MHLQPKMNQHHLLPLLQLLHLHIPPLLSRLNLRKHQRNRDLSRCRRLFLQKRMWQSSALGCPGSERVRCCKLCMVPLPTASSWTRHVRIQSYRVLFKLAQAQFSAAGKSIVVILDGQFGDKLSADYIQHGLQSLPVAPLLVYFTCPADVQYRRMQGRGAQRDQDKYGQLDQLHQKWVTQHEAEVHRWDASCASKGYRPVLRVNSECSVESQVHRLLQEIAG
ncbi:hypothetical protein DUNSADRAFT_2495 [Dunaliella salina]|uniref:Uncharacterized protein n=1 Tax=Dunaliella salina TaxID=3046 RepID=A0ABQ7FW97_DUNSA|nr:hypothetical protein DUNSADRAFT_2495 [Dunaliella salina]|eukprot:KAF5826628.1 hypothetical protein DUNSADRAFT_2495 [Dunaliella salina]